VANAEKLPFEAGEELVRADAKPQLLLTASGVTI
jgi:hypothetical protein